MGEVPQLGLTLSALLPSLIKLRNSTPTANINNNNNNKLAFLFSSLCLFRSVIQHTLQAHLGKKWKMRKNETNIDGDSYKAMLFFFLVERHNTEYTSAQGKPHGAEI